MLFLAADIYLYIYVEIEVPKPSYNVCRVALCMSKTVKYYFKIEVEFERQVSDTDELQHTTAQFYVPPMISASDPLDIHSVISSFQNSIEAFTSRGSWWNVSQILQRSLSMGVFRPTAGSLFIQTPPEIAKKRAIINPRNFDLSLIHI